METKLQLSDVERRILINQYEILAVLRPKEAESFNRCAEIIRAGYYEMWDDEAIGWLSKPMLRKEMLYVADVLDMYDWLQISYDRLPEAEKATIDASEVLFPGFDGNNETEYMGYARFLREKMDRFTTVGAPHGLNSHHPTRHMYNAMLRVLPKREGVFYLSAAKIRAVLDAPRTKVI
jgi:uncharacterized protein YfbU (UPF0304 family)